MRAVNLLPKDDLAANSIRNEDPAVVIGSALGLVVLIALAGAFYMSHSQAAAQQQKLNAARLELGKLSLDQEAGGQGAEADAADHPDPRRHRRGVGPAHRSLVRNVDADRVGPDPARVRARHP